MSLHHVGLRVAILDRATAFYSVLGATPLCPPIDLTGQGAALAMAAGPGVHYRIGLLGFPDGSGVELFEFGDDPPRWLEPARPEQRLPHLGIQVDDVDAALDRAEAAGGSRLWRRPGRWGSVRVIYLHDPDGNVVELLDGPLTAIAAG